MVVLPEISFTPILTAIGNDMVKATLFLEAEIKKMAKYYSLYICGGSGIYDINGKIYNQSFLVVPNGDIIYQPKINLTEGEKRRGLIAGYEIQIITTPFVKMAICTCYDIEFPELVRKIVLEDVDLILTPAHTESQFGKHRVQFCAQARAIENHIYVASASLVGNNGPAPFITGTGRSVIYSPIDNGFNPNGIVAQGEHEKEYLLITNVDIGKLHTLRKNCSTSPLLDYKTFIKQQIKFKYNAV